MSEKSSMPSMPSPKASRSTRSRWLDPKLFLGILLVLGSMAIGANLIGKAQQTTLVLRADTDIKPGEPITRDMLVETKVRFDDDADRSKYTSRQAFGGKGIPSRARSTSYVRKGELIPIDAMAKGRYADIERFAVTIPAGTLPKGLQKDDRVDLWLAPKPGGGSGGEGTGTGSEEEQNEARAVAHNIIVLEVPSEDDSGTSPSVTLGIDHRTEGAAAKTAFDVEQFYTLQRTLELRLHVRAA